MKIFNLDSVKNLLENYKIWGSEAEKIFTHVRPIEQAEKQSLVWISPLRQNKQMLLENTEADIIICDSSFDFSVEKLKNKCCIAVENPKLSFLRIVKELFGKKNEAGIHPSAVIHKNALIDPSVYIGPNSYIGNCEIGANTVIYGNCYLYDDVKIGENVMIHAGAVIGADGFGYSRNEHGEFEKFPHVGGVIIADNVDIGANACIDKGSLGNTIIKRGAKIDNLVHIAHNVIVGENTAVIALAMIGGSTVIGNNAWISPGTSIRDGVSVGDNSLIGLGGVVTKSVPENEVWAGVPAKKIR